MRRAEDETIWVNELRRSLIILGSTATLILASCKVVVEVPAGGRVDSVDGSYTCEESNRCEFEITDTNFEADFIGMPDFGFTFSGWKKANRHFCGQRQSSCLVSTKPFAVFPEISAWIAASDDTFFLVPIFEASEEPSEKQPDLIITSISSDPEIPEVGEVFRLLVTVENQGDGPSGETTLDYLLSTDQMISDTDSQFSSDPVVPLEPGNMSEEETILILDAEPISMAPV